MNNDWTFLSKYLSLVTEIGTTMALTILVFFFIGLYGDAWLHAHGLFLTGSLLCGIAGGIYNVRRILMKSLRDDDLDMHHKKKGG